MKPNSWRVVSAIGRVSAMELIRDKILYNIVLFAVLLLGAGFLASKLTFVRPDRIVLDFGLTAVNLSCAAIAIFAGSAMLGREFERRTIFIALAHPISRMQFVVGKFLGIGIVLFLNWIILSAAYLLILSLTGNVAENFHAALFLGLFLVWIESLVLAGFAVLFSTISTTSLSAVMAVGIYLIGNNVSQIRLMAARTKNILAKETLEGFATFLPNLEYFNLGNKVTYALPVVPQFIFVAVVYGFALVAIAVLFAGVLIRNKEG